jgi:hypothetical protein
MAKFNTTARTIKTTNKSGHAAYRMADKSKLVSQVLCSFFNEAKFYGDNSTELQETIKRVIANEPEFVAKLAVYARREFNMRTVSHVLAAHLAHEPAGKPFAKNVVKAICLRGDDATEVLACYLDLFGKPIPNALRKGLADVLRGFNEYTMAKYKGTGNAVKMRDLLCLCRPTPTNTAQAEMWKRCLENKLQIPYTWETELSAKGNNTETWEALIDSGKVGYMALLRNLRNILTARPNNVDKVLDTIQNPEAVKRSKQLPFRFLSAYREVANIAGSRVFDALENAVETSIDNMPKLPGTTVIAVDTSGSMCSTLSGNSKVKCGEVAMLLGLIANKICDNSIFYTFNTQIKKYAVSQRTGILDTVVNHCSCGGGTIMRLPFLEMITDNIKTDRIIILSDNECNDPYGGTVQELADRYRKKANNDLWVHAIDLQGYGTQQFCGPKTNIIAGWSEKVFQFILLAEQGEGGLEKTIEEYTY